MTEREFFESARQQLRETGELGDVFPCMVEWNVPRFLLRQLWPDVLSQYPSQQITGKPHLCFAASETGWKQRIENIQSRARKTADGRYELQLDKAYVMQGETILLLLRLEDEFCLALIPFPDSSEELTLIEREEPHTIFESSQGQRILHYRLKGTVIVDSVCVHPIKRRSYSLSGIQVPGREITGLALLAITLAEVHSYAESQGLRDRFRLAEKALLTAREKKRQTKDDVKLALGIIQDFAALPVPKHSLWTAWKGLAPEPGP